MNISRKSHAKGTVFYELAPASDELEVEKVAKCLALTKSVCNFAMYLKASFAMRRTWDEKETFPFYHIRYGLLSIPKGTDGKPSHLSAIHHSGRTATDADRTAVARLARIYLYRHAVWIRPF